MIQASTWMKQIIQKAQIKTEEIRMLAISLQTHDNDSQNQLYQIDDCWEKTRSSMKQKSSNKAHKGGGCELITTPVWKNFMAVNIMQLSVTVL